MKLRYRFNKQINLLECDTILKQMVNPYSYLLNYPDEDGIFILLLYFNSKLNEEEIQIVDKLMKKYQEIDFGRLKYKK